MTTKLPPPSDCQDSNEESVLDWLALMKDARIDKGENEFDGGVRGVFSFHAKGGFVSAFVTFIRDWGEFGCAVLEILREEMEECGSLSWDRG